MWYNKPLMADLNPEQKKAVEHKDGPLLIIAGAGTGKTTVVTERIKHLIAKKFAAPSEILALTFTDRAAREMEDRVDRAMPYGYTQMWISTFHGFCDTILREEGLAIGMNPNFKLMTEAESITFLKKHLFKLDLDYFRPLGNPNKFLENLLTHFSRLSDEDITPKEYIKFAKAKVKSDGENEDEKLEIKKTLELANAYEQYSMFKLKEGLLDFADLISQTLFLLRTRKNVLKRLQERFKYILVDEFQDTNFAQNELAILLAGKQQNITVVADDDQAIYRWRGAALSNVIQFRNNFPKAEVITLIRNYRSTQEILNHAYDLIQANNPDRLEVVENINKKLVSDRKIEGKPVELIFEDRVDEEAEEIAKTIKNLTKSKQNYSDVAILVRANNHAQPITVALQRNKIPYQFLGPGYLLRQEEIKNLIAYFKVLYNLDDSVSLFRVLSMDILNLSVRDISNLLSIGRKNNSSLFEVMENVNRTYFPDETKDKIEKITKMISRHLELTKKEPPGQILYYFLLDSGLLNSFLEVKSERDEKVASNIAKFFDKIKTFETVNPDANIYNLVDYLDLQMEMGDSPLVSENDFQKTNAVNILTIHSSKGLEFPIVFMVNLVNERFPTRERKEKIPLDEQLIKEVVPVGDHHLQEERRLFYVGMTRARDRLFFTGAKFYADGKREKKISPFVFEAIPQLEKVLNEKKEIKQLSFLEAIQDYQEEKSDNRLTNDSPLTIQYLSYTQLQTFAICPLHYRAQFLLKLPTPKTAPLSFGISVHSAFNEFYEKIKAGEKQTVNDFQDILTASWISEGYQEKSHEQKMRDLGRKIIDDYYKKLFDSKKLPLANEIPFSFFLKRPDGKPPVKIVGKMDRIDDLGNGQIEIIDYKTGSSDGAFKQSYEFQLGVYALAATEVNDPILKKKPEDITVSLMYLEDLKKISKQMTTEDVEKTKKMILEKIEEIEKSDFKCSHSILCQNCEYKILCNAN